MRVLRAAPLEAEAYAPYGNVIAAATLGHAGKPANQGSARRFDRLAALDNPRATASPNLSVFRCSPMTARPVRIALLEKHPASTQVFVPMNASRYLVVVAVGGDRPDLASLAAFVATGRQGVSYHPGIWHHPMIALDTETDFACFVFEDGTAGDCVEVPLTESEAAAIDLD